jgi:uncharacterized protein YjbI with pentapeptide repeats
MPSTLRAGLIAGALAGCASSAAPMLVDRASYDAIQCMLFAQTSGAPGVLHTSTTRTLTVGKGQRSTLELAPLTMKTALNGDSFGIWVVHGDRQLFRGLYQIGANLPDNQFIGNHGFTGLIYLEDPDAPAQYQLLCRSIVKHGDPDRPSERRAQYDRETSKRIASLKAQLYAPASPLQARVDAALALHALRQRSFPGVRLEGASMAGVDLRETHMLGAHLAGANLQQASLYFDRLDNADLSGANLEDANLYSASLNDAHLKHANLRRARLQNCELERASLVEADLAGAYLMYAKLAHADLSRANLERANLEGADLNGANLRGANLLGAQLKDATFKDAKLEGAKLDPGANREAMGVLKDAR